MPFWWNVKQWDFCVIRCVSYCIIGCIMFAQAVPLMCMLNVTSLYVNVGLDVVEVGLKDFNGGGL